jgi:predicted ribosomally synthesized peptide with SipW-like signal peptide
MLSFSYKHFLAGVLMIGVLATLVRGTSAIFTDTASVGANVFTTGTIDITTSPTSALLTNMLMAPGDRVNNSITVSNSGSLAMRYAIQQSATDPDSKNLRSQLDIRVGLRGGASCDFPYFNTDGTTTTLTDDTQLALVSSGIPGTATNLVGDATQGSQSGDRSLAAAASEVLCFAVVLPSGVGNAYQNATTTTTFDFTSEQTANN